MHLAAPTIEERSAARLLRIPVDSDPADVRTAFRALAKAGHPDRSGAGDGVDVGRLTDARDALLDRAERRARHRAEIEAEHRRRRDLARARRRTLFDRHLIDLTTPLGQMVDVTG